MLKTHQNEFTFRTLPQTPPEIYNATKILQVDLRRVEEGKKGRNGECVRLSASISQKPRVHTLFCTYCWSPWFNLFNLPPQEVM